MTFQKQLVEAINQRDQVYVAQGAAAERAAIVRLIEDYEIKDLSGWTAHSLANHLVEAIERGEQHK